MNKFLLFLYLIALFVCASPVSAKSNTGGLCEASIYVSRPTYNITWIIDPDVNEMRLGLVERRKGNLSRYSITYLTRKIPCSQNVARVIDGGGYAYIEINFKGKIYTGGISKGGLMEMLERFYESNGL